MEIFRFTFAGLPTAFGSCSDRPRRSFEKDAIAAITALETMRGLHEFGSGWPVVELSRTGLDPMPEPAQLFNFLKYGSALETCAGNCRGGRYGGVPLLPK
jgi:hypothetical protein